VDAGEEGGAERVDESAAACESGFSLEDIIEKGNGTMAEYMLYVGCHGIDDPNRAGLVFAAARGTLNNAELQKASVGAKIALLADAVLLMKSPIAENTIIAGGERGSVAHLMSELGGRVEIWV
jgi:hypothetical protein